MLYRFLFALFLQSVASQYYYKEISPFRPLNISTSCILTNPPGDIACTLYQIQGIQIEATCLEKNVVRIVGEFDTVRIICSCPHALDFRYHGIQPTEAVRAEWYKEVLPGTNGSMSAFGVDVQIRSVESLYQYYLKQFKENGRNETISRHDYPRSGNFIFRGIYKKEIETNIFIYLEDSATPSFLRNTQTRISVKDSQLRIPCIPSHYDKLVEVNFTDKDGGSRDVEYTKSTDPFQGFLLNAAEDAHTQFGLGVYSCYMKDRNSSLEGVSVMDQLSLEFTPTSTDSDIRFGLNTSVSKNYGQAIKYYSKKSSDGNIQIQIACKVHELGVPTYLGAIEAENFAMMNLKREFTFPAFVGRSYTALSSSTSGELTFEILLNGKFKTRYGGATFCKSGDTLEVEEFAVPFVGDVSKRVFDTDWTKFQRETSEIRIHYELKVVGEEEDSEGTKEQFAGTELTFECKLIIAIVVKPVIWRSIWRNGSKIEEKVDYNWTGKLEDTSYFTQKLETDLVGVECAGTFYYASFWREISVPLHINPGSKPKIEDPTEDLILRVGALNQGVTCTATGKPTPKLSWFKNRNQLHAFLTTNGSLFHQIQKVESTHGGEYICKAENVYGTDEKVFKYVVEGDDANYGALVGIAVTVFLITLIGAVVYVKFFRKEQVGLTRAEVEEFLAGEKHSAIRNSSAYAHEFAHLTPYDKSYELDDSKFQIDTTHILGTGAYGVVFKGIVDGRPVAVKTTKKNADKAYLKALLSELKIMIYLGNHEHIVQLVGASTRYLEKGTLYIFVPFCGLGNLEKYLRANRPSYEESSADSEYRNLEQGVFNFKDLLAWSIQIVEGMEYLASRKVIHGDLAARNILLTAGKQARITDFGLSRQLYGYASYVKKHQEPLPWRWMALESLRDLSFSTSSDIWSYGILLWEIFSLGEVPYPGMSWTLDFVEELENGLRMARPKRIPEYLYTRIPYLCWHKVPSQRPSFASIRETFADFKSLYCAPSTKDETMGTEESLCETQTVNANDYTNSLT